MEKRKDQHEYAAPGQYCAAHQQNLTSLHAAYIEAMHLRDEYEKEHGTPEVLSDDYELEHYLVTTTLDISLDPVALSEAGESITLDEMSVMYFMLASE